MTEPIDIRKLVERLRKVTKDHGGFAGSFVRARLTKLQLRALLDAVDSGLAHKCPLPPCCESCEEESIIWNSHCAQCGDDL